MPLKASVGSLVWVQRAGRLADPRPTMAAGNCEALHDSHLDLARSGLFSTIRSAPWGRYVPVVRGRHGVHLFEQFQSVQPEF